jgi:hypothetical protein
MVAPVVKELELRGVACDVIALTTGYRKAQQMGLQPLGYSDFQHLVRSLPEVLAWGDQLYPENQHPDVSAVESRLYLGVNYAQWVDDHGVAVAASMYATQGRRGFYPLTFMRAIVNAVKPDIVVTTNSNRSEQAVIEAAAGLSIPTLSMVDLFLGVNDPFCKRRLYADKLTVISDSVKQVLQSVGVAPTRIVVTGNPAFDGLSSGAVRQQAREFRHRLGWDNLKVVMFAGHMEDLPDTPLAWRGRLFCIEVEAKLRQWVAQGDDRALIVRYHPSESHLYPDFAPHPRMHRSDPSTDPLHPTLLASDFVVVQASTVGLEASLAGRAVLCLRYAPSVQGTSYNYADLGLATAIDSLNELIMALNSDTPMFRIDPDSYLVGRSAAAVCTQIEGLMHSEESLPR